MASNTALDTPSPSSEGRVFALSSFPPQTICFLNAVKYVVQVLFDRRQLLSRGTEFGARFFSCCLSRAVRLQSSWAAFSANRPLGPPFVRPDSSQSEVPLICPYQHRIPCWATAPYFFGSCFFLGSLSRKRRKRKRHKPPRRRSAKSHLSPDLSACYSVPGRFQITL